LDPEAVRGPSPLHLEPLCSFEVGGGPTARKHRQSGLWNVDHVGVGYDPAFIKTLEGYVRQT